MTLWLTRQVTGGCEVAEIPVWYHLLIEGLVCYQSISQM